MKNRYTSHLAKTHSVSKVCRGMNMRKGMLEFGIATNTLFKTDLHNNYQLWTLEC